MPIFSIITVSYNEVASIKHTLDSIVNQTFKDFELIVVDGGSTDGTKEIIAQYDGQISWWCSEPDKGIYNAMNKGIAHATGKYVNFMNAGDYFFNNDVLQHVYDSRLCPDVIEGHVVRTDNNKRHKDVYEDLYVHLFSDTLSHQGTFIKRELLVSHPYDEKYKIVSDWKFWIETLILEQRSYAFLDLDIAYYDISGISSTHPQKIAMEREEVIQELFTPYMQKFIHSYNSAYELPLVKYAVYLDKHWHKGYELLRKIAKRVVKVAKWLQKRSSSLQQP
jgi:glycosyltransferase involved in cell wall biosynthesis